MKSLKYLVLAALATPALAADPSLLKQYRQIQQAFYEFDPHAYRSFSCHVDVTSLDATVANTRQMLAPHADGLQVKDSLTDYSLTVDSKTGLSIHNPTLDIQIVSDKGMVDPARVRLGIGQTKQGFDTQVQGADQIISGIFNSYLGSVPALTSVTRDGKKWVVKYVEGGASTVDTIDGSHVHEEVSAQGMSVVVDSEYTPSIGGRLALQSSDIRITQGAQTAVTAMSMTYQKLGTLQVPATIVTNTTLSNPGLGQTTVEDTLSFQACSIKD